MMADIVAPSFKPSLTSRLTHCLFSVVKNRAAAGRRRTGERNWREGLEAVLWVKRRGELGGRKGRRRSILLMGSRGRMIGVVVGLGWYNCDGLLAVVLRLEDIWTGASYIRFELALR